MSTTGKLNPKQTKFCEQYLIDLNATQAAIRAGYSRKTAGAIGFALLKKTEIQSHISELRVQLAQTTDITPERVLRELGRIAFADPRKVMSWGPKGVVLIDSSELTEDEAALVSEVSETTTAAGGSMKVKLHDKLGALEKIGKHLGMFVDKHEHTGAEGQPLTLVVSLAGATEEDDAD